MFKYKIKVVGWEYRIYRKKSFIALWQDTGISCLSMTNATKVLNLLSGVN